MNMGQISFKTKYTTRKDVTNSFHILYCCSAVDCVWNVIADVQKLFFFRRKGRVHLNRQGRQFSRLLAAEVCASAVVILDTPCSEVVWRVLTTRSIRQFPLHFSSRASPCAITFQLDSTTNLCFIQSGAAVPYGVRRQRERERERERD